jgi:hypothetical protein
MQYDKTSTTRVLRDHKFKKPKTKLPITKGPGLPKVVWNRWIKVYVIYICQSYISCNLSNKCFPNSHVFCLKLKRTFKDKSTTTFGSLFCQALWNKGPKRKRSKKEKKRSKGKALRGVLGPHPPPYGAIFFFQLGTNGRSKRKKLMIMRLY